MRQSVGTASFIGRLLGAVLILPVILGTPAPADAVPDGDIRPLQERGRRLVESAARRSATFRQLLVQVAASDVIVYVDLNPFEEHRLDGLLRFASAANGARYLVVWLSPRRIDDALIATLAHELRHAVEVGGAPEVTSEASLGRLYQRIGHSDHPGKFESEEAQAIALKVAAELRERR